MHEQESERVKRLRVIRQTKERLTNLFGDFKINYETTEGTNINFNIFTITHYENLVQIRMLGYVPHGISGVPSVEINVRSKKNYHFGRRVALLLESAHYSTVLTKDYLEEDSPAKGENQ